ncbi:hypothetical protein SAMN02949497_2049 [Methylomagnum ishizawai]|uniref:Uncharacterized protein n=1 Tax=Methylomagnum ishizawai TaxID=1760988 RepID=A0A1Y6CWS2_9GAMM|nr:hypothetical protein [Methylomagnum ishizawai]SMF94716.1 hypothetical protein SAMN02949497_2049 [Methylomagnum ishizawai]
MIGEYQSYRLDPRKNPGFPILGLLKLVVTMAFIYALIVPIALLDAVVSLYQYLCFPIYGLAQVERRRFVSIPRQGYESLNFMDRFNCHYCSYANGVLRYAQKIAAETEKMWCPIRQKLRKGYAEPPHHQGFAENGEKEALLQYYARYELVPAEAEPAEGAACPAETGGS